MRIDKLEEFLTKEPAYRLTQAKKAIFQQLIADWQELTSFPLKLREELNKNCPLTIKAQIFPSKTKESIKARIFLNDGLGVESVLLRHADGRNTVCVSCQVGCPIGCKFCATGRMGFKRNLDYLEILEQVLFFSRFLKKEEKKVTNLVFMGMGEPFLNYENVMKAIKILNDKNDLNIGARHISISTVGIIEGIKKLAQEKLQLNLAISLHAPNNQLRSQLIPINEKYPLELIFKTVDDYIKKTKRKVMFEYILIKDVNDSDEYALQLSKLMKKPLYFLNLILYNPTGIFQPASFARVKQFKEILKKQKIEFSQRYRFGQSIKAACGQLNLTT